MMNLGDIGSWASIVGLVITLFTFFMASNVNKKVNEILKAKNDRKFFSKKAPKITSDLKHLQEIVENGEWVIWGSTMQQSKIYNAIEVVSCSWDVLLPNENKIVRKIKIISWNHKFKRIKEMYSGKRQMNSKEMVTFLSEFITFLEKEQENDE